MNKLPIADLHCDLLCYLASDSQRTPYDKQVRCAIPQLQEGGVKLQTMAVFTETATNSLQKGLDQIELFKELPRRYPGVFNISNKGSLSDTEAINISLAIENASSICSEEEPLQNLFDRIQSIEKEVAKLIYVSLTWNTENRFGGGASTQVGLKPDGKRFLEFLHQRKIGLDFSHASDRLVYDCLDTIDRQHLQIPVLASHSNARAVAQVPRNLPDEFIREITRRGGIIGLNFVRDFVGRDCTSNFAKQLDHFLSLDTVQNMCFGADFYFGGDVSPTFRKRPEQIFFPSFDDASVYPKILKLWETKLNLAANQMEKIAHGNLTSFLNAHIFV